MDQLTQNACDFFKAQLTNDALYFDEDKARELLHHVPHLVAYKDNVILLRLISTDEVKSSVFFSDPCRAARSEGFNWRFYQSC